MAPTEKKNVNSEKTDINILLLGETGVGKSTFVNSFANYLLHPDIKTAASSELKCLISTSFEFTDKNLIVKKVKIGDDDKNENLTVGQSATLACKSYLFPILTENRRVRLIDTPGIGDTQGIAQDNINFDNILAYISQFKYIHAICFLLKPNNTRLNAYFLYCIKHLLTHLEKSAANNIVFVFTNTRSTFYMPGETKPVLDKVLEEIRTKPPYVSIEFSKNNTFCFDNEAFKFIVGLQHGVKFENMNKKDFERSWETSSKAAWNLLTYVGGTAEKRGLVPHEVENTLSVNQARKQIFTLSKPLADITQNINDNIIVLKRHEQRINDEKITITDLQKLLYIPNVNLRQRELRKPVTVCTARKCCELYVVDSLKQWHYKQRCHKPCHLQNVPREIIGSPELVNCTAMGGTPECKICKCHFSIHMHIYYETEIYSDRIEDSTVKTKLKNKDDLVLVQSLQRMKMKRRQSDLEEEKELIIKNVAKFAHFLKTYSIIPYNDSFASYIKILIKKEKAMQDDGNEELIDTFKDLLYRHEEEKQILDNALEAAKKHDPKVVLITPEQVHCCVSDLFSLKLNGEKIKALFDIEHRGRMAEHENSIECVIPIPRRENKSDKQNQFKEENKELISLTKKLLNSMSRNVASDLGTLRKLLSNAGNSGLKGVKNDMLLTLAKTYCEENGCYLTHTSDTEGNQNKMQSSSRNTANNTQKSYNTGSVCPNYKQGSNCYKGNLSNPQNRRKNVSNKSQIPQQYQQSTVYTNSIHQQSAVYTNSMHQQFQQFVQFIQQQQFQHHNQNNIPSLFCTHNGACSCSNTNYKNLEHINFPVQNMPPSGHNYPQRNLNQASNENYDYQQFPDYRTNPNQNDGNQQNFDKIPNNNQYEDNSRMNDQFSNGCNYPSGHNFPQGNLNQAPYGNHGYQQFSDYKTYPDQYDGNQQNLRDNYNADSTKYNQQNFDQIPNNNQCEDNRRMNDQFANGRSSNEDECGGHTSRETNVSNKKISNSKLEIINNMDQAKRIIRKNRKRRDNRIPKECSTINKSEDHYSYSSQTESDSDTNSVYSSSDIDNIKQQQRCVQKPTNEPSLEEMQDYLKKTKLENDSKLESDTRFTNIKDQNSSNKSVKAILYNFFNFYKS